jgi:NAD-dependent deacetylase
MIHNTIPGNIIHKIATAHHIVFFTGAGVSAESNIPPFRGNDGIWTKFKPEELANFDAFIKNPKLVWEWYAVRKRIIHESQPNAGHFAIAQMEKLVPHVTVITQNIDNLHRRAGSSTVFELHGNIERNYCIRCGKTYPDDILNPSEFPPICTKCGGLVRPDVVWFGEFLPNDEWGASEKAACECDIFFSLGTSGIVYPAASIPRVAKQAGAYLIEINPEETPISTYADITILGKSGVILPDLVRFIEEIMKERKYGHETKN